MQTFMLVALTLIGLCVGSFCNVLIYRIPLGEEFVKTPSHCMSCGHRLKWHELIPVASWLVQGGKCRSCGVKLSAQYPVIEALNGVMWLITGLLYWNEPIRMVLYCVLFSMLMVLSVIDWRIFEIPNGINLTILILGVIQLAADWRKWSVYVIGLVCVSVVFLLLWFLTGGAGLGMGDVKLMAAAGLLLGWQKIILAVLIGSIAGAVIHMIRMKRGAGRKLAFGPYLAGGIWASALFGGAIISAYLGLFGL